MTTGRPLQNGARDRPTKTLGTTALVVGGGPVGLFTSLLLASYNIKSILVEKHASRNDQPKAHAINPRSLEIFRQLGLDTKHLRSIGVSPSDGDMVRFATSIAEPEMGHLPYERQDEDVKEVTPEPLFNIPQPRLEAFLEQEAKKNPLITLLKPWRWEGCRQLESDQVSSIVLDRDANEQTEIVSKYLIGCDGAHAVTRDHLGLSYDALDGGKPAVVHHLSIHLDMDLTHRPSGTLWFLVRDHGVQVFIAYDRKDNWVYIQNYDPEVLNPEAITDDYCHDLVRKALGDDVPFRIRATTLWTTCPMIADRFDSTKILNGFVVGDAAHTFPPTGGLGINTGIADAHNLAWKILAAEQGWTASAEASRALLETYTRDRRAVALANAAQSRLNQQKIFQLAMAVFGSEARGAGAQPAQDDDVIRRAIADNADHFDSLNLQIGYVYGAGPPARSCSDYRKECASGARLPHAWVTIVRRGAEKSSTLDLVALDRFTILVSRDFDHFPDEGRCSVAGIPVAIQRTGRDFEDEKGEWSRLMGLDGPARAVVVRPDQHIVGWARDLEGVSTVLSSAANGN